MRTQTLLDDYGMRRKVPAAMSELDSSVRASLGFRRLSRRWRVSTRLRDGASRADQGAPDHWAPSVLADWPVSATKREVGPAFDGAGGGGYGVRYVVHYFLMAGGDLAGYSGPAAFGEFRLS